MLIGWLLDEVEAPTVDLDWSFDLSLWFDESVCSADCEEDEDDGVSDDCPSIHTA